MHMYEESMRLPREAGDVADSKVLELLLLEMI